ncbi:MAG: ribosome maturation factor RimP [Cytophagales bacterium]|nr:ribosome maturation factor RimP [Cytophagales bacterium]
MSVEEKITELLEGTLISYPHLFLVACKFSGKEEHITKVTIFLDGEQGVSIDECAEISRKLGNDIEERDLVKAAYNLEVSSPGIDQPLVIKPQYIRNKGRDVQIELEDGKVISGKLEEVTKEGVSILEHDKSKNKSKKYSNKAIEITFQNIKKTIVLVSFN